MSYTALARKWRPKKFAELVGQEHVRRALVNALETGRVHHAFLFTGTRGVGKTTIARIFAKCLNCETGVTPEPCGVCAACKEIDSGRFVDLIEVDAASSTKVDDTRELLNNVQYAPTRGRYKVYLIDEVHMLSTHSFNALLKTLEEPPPHVKFLLATTDPQKLPVTVLSRCLQFNLKRMPVGQIAEHMKVLLEKEGVPFEPAGLRLVAQAADGSMRDGLSLLDQLIAFGGGKAGEEEARAMLGTIARDHVERLAGLLATMNVPELVQCARSLEEFAPDYAQVLDELAGLLVRVAMKQAISDYEGDDLYAPELLERLAKAFSPEDIQLFYQTAITGRRDLGLAPDPRTGFEMTLLRMIAFRPANDAGMAQGPVSGPVSAAAGRGGAAAAQAAIARGGGAGAAQDGGAAVAQGGGRATAGQTVVQGGGANGAAAGPPPSGGGASAASSGAQSGGSAAAAARAAAQAGSGGASAARAAALAAARGGASGGPASPRGVATVGSSGGSQQNDASLGSAGLRDGSGATVGGGLSATAAPGPGGQHDGGAGAEGESGTGASGSRGQREGAVGTESRGPTATFGSGGQHDAGGGAGAEGQRGTGASGSRGQREGTGGASQRTSTGPGEQGNRASAGFSRGQSSDTADAEAEWLSMQHGQDEGASASQASGEASGSAASWISILNQLDLQGAARQLASHCVLAGRQPGLVRLALDPRVKFVRTSAQEEKLAQALSRHYGETVRLEFTMAGGDSETPAQAEQRASQQELEVARQALETDPGVQSLRERFGATLLPETVRPIK